MTRFYLRVGDVFCAVLKERRKRYFQYIGTDITQLNSEVIRVFAREYEADAAADVTDVVRDKVDFYAHVIVKLGVKSGLWAKIGKSAEVGCVPVYFKSSEDDGVRPGQEPIKISERWWVWTINQEAQYVGRLTGKYESAEIGSVLPPRAIVERMETGEYQFEYPRFQ